MMWHLLAPCKYRNLSFSAFTGTKELCYSPMIPLQRAGSYRKYRAIIKTANLEQHKSNWQPYGKTLAMTCNSLALMYYHSMRPHAELIKLLPPICFGNGCSFRYLAGAARQLLALTNRTVRP